VFDHATHGCGSSRAAKHVKHDADKYCRRVIICNAITTQADAAECTSSCHSNMVRWCLITDVVQLIVSNCLPLLFLLVFLLQYKFGARTGMAPVLLGGMKIILALVFGSSLLQLMQHFPRPLLGGMLLMSGLELASSARKQMDARGCSLMLLTAAAILGLQDTGAGFLVGLVAAALAAGYDCCSSAQHRQHVVMCWQAVALRLCACFRGSRDPQNHAAGVKYTPCASDV